MDIKGDFEKPEYCEILPWVTAMSGLLSPSEEISWHYCSVTLLQLTLKLCEWITFEPIAQTLLSAVSMEHWIVY